MDSEEAETTCPENDAPPKTDYTQIGIKKLQTYYIESVVITNRSKETKRYIQVNITNQFKFCPDFKPDYNTKGKCILHGDYVIMAFCCSDELGIYRIKNNGKKASLLFSTNCRNFYYDELNFYKADDGRYILTCSHKIVFFDPDNLKARFEAFDIENSFSEISVLYSGNRMFLHSPSRYDEEDSFFWFDGKTDIAAENTGLFRKSSEICYNNLFNDLLRNHTNKFAYAMFYNYDYIGFGSAVCLKQFDTDSKLHLKEK